MSAIEVELLFRERAEARGDLVAVEVCRVALGHDVSTIGVALEEEDRYRLEQLDLRCDDDGSQERAAGVVAEWMSDRA